MSGQTPGTEASPSAARAPVPLIEVFVAGYQFHQGPEIERSLRVGDTLVLEREAKNLYDSQAIRLLWRRVMIGFVPRQKNEVLARLLDHKRELKAKVIELHPEAEPWRRVRVGIELVS